MDLSFHVGFRDGSILRKIRGHSGKKPKWIPLWKVRSVIACLARKTTRCWCTNLRRLINCDESRFTHLLLAERSGEATPRDQLRVGWLSGADANVGPVLEALRTRVPVTLEAMLFVEDEVADATTLVDLPSDLIRRSLRAPSAGHQLATLDLIFLPDTASWSGAMCSQTGPPPVIFASRASTGQLGLTVDPSAVDASAALGALMLLVSPTRRKSFDLLRGMVAVDAVGDVPCRSRVEGVFDSSYSLRKRIASQMALDARGKSDVSLATFEQEQSPAWIGQPYPLPRDRVQALWAKSAVNTSAPDVALRNAWPPAVQGMRGHLRVLANYHWEETRFPERSPNNSIGRWT